jgi:antitoxin component YwqK of YwqJK toxin-antitoxin module
MQLGTFKAGKEFGQQRIIQSYPLKQRQISIFTCINSKINGPALIEKANGKVETGSYLNDQQVGEWKNKYLDGKTETEFYVKGKKQTAE